MIFSLETTLVSEYRQKRAICAYNPDSLTPDQLAAVNLLTDNWANGNNVSVITGYAGVGKTYMVARLIEKILFENKNANIAFCATTNKAVGVAFRMCEFTDNRIHYTTAHSLLALRENVQPDGEILFTPDYKTEPPIKSYLTKDSYVFVDEASMLSKHLWKYFIPYFSKPTKFIFIGDSFQAPPVKETISPVFDADVQFEHNIVVATLDKIMRQAEGNPIIKIATSIRLSPTNTTAISKRFPDDIIPDDTCGYFNLQNNHDWLLHTLHHVFTSEQFKNNHNFAKLLCWRNDTVNAYNKIIRRFIYPNQKLRRVEVGEKLVTKSPIVDSFTEQTKIPNATELTVLEVTKSTESVQFGIFDLSMFNLGSTIEVPFYYTKVAYTTLSGKQVETIKVLTDLGFKTMTEVMNKLKKVAIQMSKAKDDTAKSVWRDYYKLERLFANVGYNYAITTHLAQGSTYENVIIHEQDLRANSKISERNRLLYTAITRAAKRILIY